MGVVLPKSQRPGGSRFHVVNASWKPLYIVAPSTSWLLEEILA